jgi:acetyl-CoA C-acetyltransferase
MTQEESSRDGPNGRVFVIGARRTPIGRFGDGLPDIVATLLHDLDRRGGRYGLATLCLGGGGGSVARAFERVGA